MSKIVKNWDTKFSGINWDDPEITPNQKVRYDACISIPKQQLNFLVKPFPVENIYVFYTREIIKI